MGRNGITIQDVATRTGVSKVTVSYVLNDRSTSIKISEATRQRVKQAASEMGYHPNALARGLARRQTDTLTVVMHSPRFFAGGSSFGNDMMRGLLEKANERNYDVMVHTKSLPDVGREVLALADGRADGALLLRGLDDPLAALLLERGFPFVQIFSRSPLSEVWTVDCDNVVGGKLATNYLLDLGHRRIGHIAGSPDSAPAVDRLRGYEEALEGAGIDADPRWQCTISYAGGDFAPLVALMQGPDAPTALFSWSDDVALRAIQVLRDTLGLRVPGDVSIIGFDGTDLGDHTAPRLTSVRQPIEEMAGQGVEMLIAQIRKETVATKQAVFAPSLLVRDSCQAPGQTV